MISLALAFFFASVSNLSAQNYAKFKVTAHETNCSCATIVKKTVEWEIRLVSNDELVDEDWDDVTSESSPYDVETTCVVYDDTMYYIIARLIYEDASIDPVCCTGEGISPPIDGEDLISGDANVDVYMQ